MRIAKKQGFTLLEIIIVIIIVGVLASLALPRFFSTVEFSKSTEALAGMGTLRQSMERCFTASNSTYSGCTIASLDVDTPANSPGNHFTYLISAQSTTGFTIVATRNTYDGATADGNTITLIQAATGVTRSGIGAYAGIK